MPGSLPNVTIKNAIDQVIQAINDLNLEVNEGDVNVTVSTADIVAKLEEIRTLYETETTAQIVAQNTNFEDLIAAMQAQTAAIGALTLSCQTIVETTELHQTINAGCSCSGGTEIPPVIGDDPEIPPDGWGPPDPSIPNRRCKAVNRLVDGLDYILTQLVAMNVREGALLLGIGMATTIILTILAGTFSGPFGVLVGVAGGITSVILALIGGSVRPDFLKDLIQDEEIRKDMVCALYSAENAEQAMLDFLQVWTDNGANNPEYYFLEVILTQSGATNSIDYSRGGSEIDLDGYEPTVDCSECNEAGLYEVITGTPLSATNANPFQAEMADLPGGSCSNRKLVIVNFSQPFKLTGISDLSGYANCEVGKIYIYASQGAGGDSISITNTLPDPENYFGALSLAVIVSSTTTPTIQIEFEWEE